MNKQISLYALSGLLLFGCAGISNKDNSIQKVKSIDFSHIKINDNFWSPRLDKHASVTLKTCIDQIENQTGRIRNFENAAKKSGNHSGIFFDDSDVYKALEGMAYSLVNNPDPALETKIDEWTSKIAAAQLPDGYINTFYTLTNLEKRWTNMDKHEMYCTGHLIEAGVAYYYATGKKTLLDVGQKMADHMMTIFGPGKRNWVPGHEEIELALVKLYNVTKERKYVDFSDWLLQQRGHGYGTMGDEGEWNPFYYQDEKPVKEMTDIAGHAVRCMYLYCGMSDVASICNDSSYIPALNSLWDDVVLRNMYITGGIGSSRHNEGFTTDYDLPNKDAYCETCASVGMVFWNKRMNQFTGDSKYIDVLERSMYNGALAGVSLSGDKFFYVNPLESEGNHHRQAWYGCACCPSQISRFLPSIGNYIYGFSKDALWVNLYIGNTLEYDNMSVKMDTDYPWNGNVKLTVLSDLSKNLKIRIPDWCKNYTVSLNSTPYENKTLDKGYLLVEGKFKKGDVVELNMDMPVEIVEADPQVKEDLNKRAIQRGPLVYCAEKIDNENVYDNAIINKSTSFDYNFDNSLLNGVVVIKANTNDQEPLSLIPYYSWDNRDASAMKVWLDYQE